VDELQRLAGEGRRAGADLAVAALGDARPRARGLGAAAPVRDPVGAADRVRAKAPHGARRGVAAPVRHGDRAGVDGFRIAGGGQGWGQEERERREEEEAVAGGMARPRHGGEGWARGGDHGGLWGGRRPRRWRRLELRARRNGSAAALRSFFPLATRRWVKGGWGVHTLPELHADRYMPRLTYQRPCVTYDRGSRPAWVGWVRINQVGLGLSALALRWARRQLLSCFLRKKNSLYVKTTDEF
jgi:hypothetical protein